MGKKELRYMWIGLNDIEAKSVEVLLIEVSTEGFTNVLKTSRNFGVAWLPGRELLVEKAVKQLPFGIYITWKVRK